jgi:alpha-L-fucosidase 2
VPLAQATAACDALREATGECLLQVVEGGIHRAENWRPSQWGYKDVMAKWLSTNLGVTGRRHLPRGARTPAGSALHKDVVFDPVRELRLDAYVPAGPGPFPGVLIVHGGGWEAGDKVTYVTPLFEVLARAGFAWFSVEYRLTPDVRHPEQLEDVRRALAFVRAQAARFRLDPGRITLLGESASGQMVAQLATEKAPVDAVVSFYGVYDFLAMVTDVGPRSLATRLFGLTALDEAARETLRRYSPAHHVRADMPPLLLIHGTNERLWAQATAMRDRLAAVGAPHELYAVEGAPHGLENWEGRPEWTAYKEKLVSWLRRRGR